MAIPGIEKNIGALLENAAHRYGDNKVVHFDYENSGFTYSQLNARVNQYANALYAEGIKRGDHVAVMLPNCPEFPLTWLALAKLGAVMVPLNNRYQAVYSNFTRSEALNRFHDREKMLTSTIKIEDITFKNKKLSLTIRDFAIGNIKKTRDQPMGKLNVLVRIIDSQDQVVFHKEKALLAQKESVFLSLGFKWLKKGKYHAFIDVKDFITGKARAQVSTFEVL